MPADRSIELLPLVVSTITIAKRGLIAPYHVHVELVLRCHGRSIVLRLLYSVVRIVYCWAGDSVRGSDAVL